MRKMTIELVPHPDILRLAGDALKDLESSLILDLLRWDPRKGMKVVLVEITLKEGRRLEDLRLPKGTEILAVLGQEGRKYTCIAKTEGPAEIRWAMKQFDLDLIWDVPIYKSASKCVTSVIGEDRELRKFLDAIKKLGDVKKVGFQKVTIHQHGLLTCLTEKQREVVVAAKRLGYYDYPRRVNSADIAKKVGLSKATVVEHLRKAEKRLMTNLLADW